MPSTTRGRRALSEVSNTVANTESGKQKGKAKTKGKASDVARKATAPKSTNEVKKATNAVKAKPSTLKKQKGEARSKDVSKARASDVFEKRTHAKKPFVLVINDKSKTFHPAIVDEKTDGVSFKLPGRDTPIAFDKGRHRLVYQGNAEDNGSDSDNNNSLATFRPTTANSFPIQQLVKGEDPKRLGAPAKRPSVVKFKVMDSLDEKEEIDKESVDDKKGGRKLRTRAKRTVNYAEDEEFSDDDIHAARDDSEKVNKKRANTKAAGKPASKIRRSLGPDMRIEYDDSDADTSVGYSSSYLASKESRDSLGGNGDWRTLGAIDY